MSTKVEVRIYGGTNLHLVEAEGLNEPSVVVQQDTTIQSVGLPKNPARQPKSTNPSWNKALYFDVSDIVSSNLVVSVMDTNDAGQQALLGKVEIPLKLLASTQNGTEVKHLHPLQTGGEIEIGLIPTHGVQAFGGAPVPTTGVQSEQGTFERAQTVGPFALKKKTAPVRGITQFQPSDLSRVFPHLARGTFGVVFRGKAKGIPEYVVIKDMEIQNQNSINEWRKEIDIMARTKSPYIAEVFGFSSQGNTLTIVMEFMSLGDLFGVLHKKAEKHPLSLIQRMRMARHCTLGLQVLHNQGFLHRDIKSMNVLVNQELVCKLTDFGCSKMVGEQGAGNMFNTVNTGTPLWMAPEVRQGVYGFPSDIYSMGLVLYEIFEKRLPDFDPNTQRTSLPMQFQSSPVVSPCVSPIPQQRPTIAQVIERLESLIRGIVATVQKVLPPEDAAKVTANAEKLKSDAARDGTPLDPKEAEQAAVYQVLLEKPIQESDGLCLKAGISVGTQGPTQQLRPQAQQFPVSPVPGQQPQLQPQVAQAGGYHVHSNAAFMTPSPSNIDPNPAQIHHVHHSQPASVARTDSGNLDPHILIVGGTNLKSADFNGFSDPYAKIVLNGLLFKTEIKKKTLDPVWNYKIPIPKDFPATVEMNIDVWDWDKIGSHDYLGYASIPFLSLTKSDDFWVDLLPRSKKDKKITGKIHIVVNV